MPERYLMIRSADGNTAPRALDPGSAYSIGRSASADIRLEHEHISRLHARLEYGAGSAWRISDLGSRNGTWVDGRAIDRPTELHDRQLIQLGPFDLWVQPTPEPPTESVGASTMQRLVAPVFDEGYTTIQPAVQAVSGIDLSVLDSLNALSLSLAETDDAAGRMQAVCRFVYGQSRLVSYCAVLGVREDEPDPGAVHVLLACPPDAEDRPYLSRTLLRKVLTDRKPMFLATSPMQTMSQPMLSIAESGPLSAFACPMLEGPGSALLYVLYAADSVDAYWQSLLQLVISHYRHADAMQRLVGRARIDRELNNAREIQLGLIPKALGGLPVDVAIGFDPCYEVGGDYADVIVQPDGRVLIALADVSGKGMPAAMLSSSLHTLVHTVADAGGGLVEIANRVNRYLIDYAPVGAFATGVLILIDPKTGEIEVLNAGHMPPILADDSGAADEFDGESFTPFGVIEQDYAVSAARLGPGQRAVVYSDGLSELATPTGAMPGMEGVRDAAAQASTGPAQDTVAGIRAWAKQLAAGTATGDDMTVVAVRLRGLS